MKKMTLVTAAIALICLAGMTQANVTIDTVRVGDPGNTGELSGAGAGGYGPDRICGSVAYTYNIGKYEVTTAQYTAFLNAVAKTDTHGLYNTHMDASLDSWACNIKRTGAVGNYVYTVGDGTQADITNWANRPVNYVNYWNSCRFANWLSNGQPTGVQNATTTEHGAYTLDGYTGWDGRSIGREPGAAWAVASEDEWYKAAYYKNGGTDVGYWLYTTRSDTAPNNVGYDGYTDPGNHANRYTTGYTIGSPYWRTNVGEFEQSGSAYGTFDQGGNVWEWNEAIVSEATNYAFRGMRGGTFSHGGDDLNASSRGTDNPASVDGRVGFRVVQVVPEPASVLALAGSLAGFFGVRRRRV